MPDSGAQVPVHGPGATVVADLHDPGLAALALPLPVKTGTSFPVNFGGCRPGGGLELWPHRFRHHFSHTWLDRGGPEGDLMELNGWSSPQMLARYGASARSARARRTYDRIMTDNP